MNTQWDRDFEANRVKLNQYYLYTIFQLKQKINIIKLVEYSFPISLLTKYEYFWY